MGSRYGSSIRFILRLAGKSDIGSAFASRRLPLVPINKKSLANKLQNIWTSFDVLFSAPPNPCNRNFEKTAIRSVCCDWDEIWRRALSWAALSVCSTIKKPSPFYAQNGSQPTSFKHRKPHIPYKRIFPRGILSLSAQPPQRKLQQRHHGALEALPTATVKYYHTQLLNHQSRS